MAPLLGDCSPPSRFPPPVFLSFFQGAFRAQAHSGRRRIPSAFLSHLPGLCQTTYVVEQCPYQHFFALKNCSLSAKKY